MCMCEEPDDWSVRVELEEHVAGEDLITVEGATVGPYATVSNHHVTFT